MQKETTKRAAKKERFYVAYGSNLNLSQMAHRCPTAEVVGTAALHDWRLWFRSRGCAVATIEQARGYTVPVLVWKLEPRDEQSLDIYEGWPHLYRKETLRITVNGRRISAMVYIMEEAGHPYGIPSKSYFHTILDGYKSADFDTRILCQAVRDSLSKSHI